MGVTSYSVTYCIYIPDNPGICFHYYCAVYDECKWSGPFWLDRIRLFVHYTISLSSLCKLIWRHWTYKMPVRYVLSSVWVTWRIFSQLSIVQYVGLCVFSLPISLMMIERIYILRLIIIIKSEVWTITHCLGLGHETMVCAVCLSVFLWLLMTWRRMERGHHQPRLDLVWPKYCGYITTRMYDLTFALTVLDWYPSNILFKSWFSSLKHVTWCLLSRAALYHLTFRPAVLGRIFSYCVIKQWAWNSTLPFTILKNGVVNHLKCISMTCW